jgi:hypothetical protein
MTILGLTGVALRVIGLSNLELGGTMSRSINLAVKPTVLNGFLVFISVLVASDMGINS